MSIYNKLQEYIYIYIYIYFPGALIAVTEILIHGLGLVLQMRSALFT